MYAHVGDRLRITGKVVGHPQHGAEIIEVRSADGGPPYLVRFDDGHEALMFPGPDCIVEPRVRN
jgi:hypothetical protein